MKRAFERDGVGTQRRAEYWDATVIRRMIDNDVYLAHTYEEVADLVSPEVAAGLDPERSYGVFWYNKVRHKQAHTGPKRNVRKPNDPSEWIAVPVPDPGIPREWVEKARAAVKDNARQPDADRRFWELKSLLFCPCGRRLTTFVARRKYKTTSYTTFHYVCSYRRRHGAGSCEHARYHKAQELEERVRRLILDLISRPEVMMERVREDVEREKERLRHSDRERAAWAEELVRVERRRDAYVEMRADGDITKEEFREKTAGLEARKAAAERELGALEGSAERQRYLDSLPELIEEYIRELPDLVHGREGTVREQVIAPPEPRRGRIPQHLQANARARQAAHPRGDRRAARRRGARAGQALPRGLRHARTQDRGAERRHA